MEISPKVILEENPTQKGVPREASGAKQQEQIVTREANPGKQPEIWHGCPMPCGTTMPLTQEGTGTPCRMTRRCHFPALLLFCQSRKGNSI